MLLTLELGWLGTTLSIPLVKQVAIDSVGKPRRKYEPIRFVERRGAGWTAGQLDDWQRLGPSRRGPELGAWL